MKRIGVGRVVLKPWIGHPVDPGVILQPQGDLKGILTVLSDPERQGFEPLEEKE
jgi:hypothetical protein